MGEYDSRPLHINKPEFAMVRPPKVRILSTGTEIMQGLYADRNAQALSLMLVPLGFSVIGHAAFADDRDELSLGIRRAMDGADLIVMTGGLGPTEDDMNREVVARLLGVELELSRGALRLMQKRFEQRGLVMPESNQRQAMIPAGGEILHNHWGTASGFVIQAPGGPLIVALPGPSHEWRPMFERALERQILPRFPDRPVRLLHTFDLAMTPESRVNELLRDLFDLPGIEFTILANRGYLRIRLLATAAEEEPAREMLRTTAAQVRERLGPKRLVCENQAEHGLAGGLIKLLLERNQTLALAESCTGGMIAAALTDVPGASSVFLGGWVTYWNEGKKRDLGVSSQTLEQHGAVSEQTVREMAEGALDRSSATFALSVSGIAGPGGGTPEKPVGTVWFALAGPNGTRSLHRQFPGDRESVRVWSLNQALDLIRQAVLNLQP